jgi:uncharacterized protein YlaI
MRSSNCFVCGKKDLKKDTVALNKKLFNKKIDKFQCMDCLADYFGVTVSELEDKIEEFKEQGCALFSN